jgi:hypothetical protein
MMMMMIRKAVPPPRLELGEQVMQGRGTLINKKIGMTLAAILVLPLPHVSTLILHFLCRYVFIVVEHEIFINK